MNPFYSIITVCYNSDKTIKNTIRSVLNQSFKNFEYIIIDGASTDNTLKIIKEFDDSRIKLFSEKDSGIADAMNKGVSKSAGQWVHILNSDDYYYSCNSLLNASKMLNKTKTNYFGICFQNKKKKIYRYYNWKYFYPKLLFKACIPHPSMIVSLEQYKKIGHYKNNFKYTSDHEFTLRMVREYPGENKNLILVVKMDGGVTHKFRKEVIYEFKSILKEIKINEFYVNIIFILKITNFYFKNFLNKIVKNLF